MLPNKFSYNVATWLTYLSPKLNTYKRYYATYHKLPNLKQPKTFDEKILWMKLNRFENDALVRQCADKWTVRQYVEQCGCPEILNDLYATWNSIDEIDWDKLPQKFVIKMNVGCGYNLICPDKSKLDIVEARQKLKLWEKDCTTYWRQHSEMQYKNIPVKILCERFLETDDGLLPADYKLFCFNGVPKYVMLCTKRETGHPEFYFFDKDRKLIRLNKRGLAAPDDFSLDMPEAYNQLFRYAEKLSKGFPFVRADFYIEHNRIIFGELTFTPTGGIDKNIPYEQNLFLGNLMQLPIDK